MEAKWLIVAAVALLAAHVTAQEETTTTGSELLEEFPVPKLPVVPPTSEEAAADAHPNAAEPTTPASQQQLPQPEKDEKKVCHTDLSGKTGLFATANFPEEYDGNANCTWNLAVDAGQRIKLTFHLMNIEHNANCAWDWVKVVDSNGSVLIHACGHLQQPFSIVSDTNNVTIYFVSDGVVGGSGFLASWKAFAVEDGDDTEDAANATANNTTSTYPGYVFSFPQSMAVSNETAPDSFCLQMFNVAEAGDVRLSVYSSENILNDTATLSTVIRHEAGDESVRCAELQLPVDFPRASAVVRIAAEFPETDYHILAYKAVRVIPLRPLVLIQTDKGDYRPKQKVSFRVLVLSNELKPAAAVDTIHEAWITDPNDARLAQFTKVALKNGLAQLSMDLDEEPALGTWKIHTKVDKDSAENEATFTVSESVLPKFSVDLKSPESILRDSALEKFTVCAHYTHGGNVKGEANVTFFTEVVEGVYYNPKTTFKNYSKIVKLESGCAEVTLNSTELLDLTQKTMSVSANAIVTEDVTGTKHNTTWQTNIQTTPFEIQFAGSSLEHIVGAFPYVGQIVVKPHPGTSLPTSDLKLEVCVRLFTSIDDIRRFVNGHSHLFHGYDEDQFLALRDIISLLQYSSKCHEYSVPASGDGAHQVKFAVPLPTSVVPANVTRLSVKVRASSYAANATTGMTQPESKLDVALTHSSVSSALSIYSEDSPRMACNSDNEVTVFLSAPAGQTLDLTYYVSSGGATVANGSQAVAAPAAATGQDQLAQYVDGALVFPVADDKAASEKNASDGVLFSHKITFPRPSADEGRISSKIRLLVILRDSEDQMLSSTREYDADSCAPQPVLAFASPNSARLRPGDNLTLTILSEKGATCGYSVVDKSVDLVPNENKVSAPKLLELKEAVAQKRIVNDRALFNSGRCMAADLLFRAFERLGLFVVSDRIVLDDAVCGALVLIHEPKSRPGPGQEVEEEGDVYFERPVAFEALGAPAPPPPAPMAIMADAAPQAFSATTSVSKFAEDSEAADGSRIEFLSTTASPAAFSGGAAGGIANTVEKNSVEVRDFFPETWLFDLVDVSDDSGNLVLNLTAPHTITTWVAEAVCSHPVAGLGVSNKTTVVVKQDFFADIVLPYSVKRGEVLPLNVSVSNAVDRALPMRLTVRDSDSYALVGDAVANTCLAKQDGQIKTFGLRANKLHTLNITVEAKVTSEADSACDPAAEAEGFTDVVVKPIEVKPEGFPVEKVETVFQCKDDAAESKVAFKPLELPADLVEDSARAWITATGDIMAPALANLDRLVTVPTGCGEQNMVTMAPNVYMMDYLKATNRSEPKLESKAREHMTSGYKREEEFKHPTGAYSIWGPKDKQGSMWLTAFVVKVFAQASKYISVGYIQDSVDWLISHQTKDGCFQDEGFIFHYDLRGDNSSLTSSVLITLLEVVRAKDNIGNFGANVPDDIIELAVGCVSNLVSAPNANVSTHSRSLAAYAMALYNDMLPELNKQLQQSQPEAKNKTARKEAGELLDSIMSTVNSSVSGQFFWKVEGNDYDNEARSVEVTAYNVLSLALADRLADALKGVKWLASKRNSVGGFVSTQDTVLAVQAISQYSIKVRTASTDLAITAAESNPETKHAFTLNASNVLLLQSEKLSALPNTLDVTVTGTGCFMVQTVLRYNVKESPEKSAFSLKVTQKKAADRMSVCAAYTGDKELTNMVVIEVELLSGFSVYPDSLEALTNEVEAPVKKYEIDEKEGRFVLYFDSMPKKETCWDVEVKRAVTVDELKPALAKIYDYYDTRDVVSVEYNLSE